MLAVTLICVASIQLVNMLRLADYNERLANGTLSLIAAELERQPEQLDALADAFDVGIQLLDYDQLSISEYSKQRLQRGQMVTLDASQDSGLQLVRAISDQQLVLVTVTSITDVQVKHTMALLLRAWHISGLPIEQFLQQLQASFGIPLSLQPVSTAQLTDDQWQRIRSDNYLIRFALPNNEAEILATLPGAGQLLKMGPIAKFDPYPWPLLIIHIVLSLLLLALGIYWVLNHFEVRMRKLEQATARLAEGHLNVRVSISGADPAARLGLSFNRMAEHIQRLISIQREMIRAVSHELRTPVARIRFGAQIIDDAIGDDEFISKQVKGMDADIAELDQLIDEILTYARLEEGGPLLDFQPIEVAGVCQQVVDETRPSGPVRVQFIGDETLASLKADAEPRYIHRAVQNLVGNGCRYAASQVLVNYYIDEDTCRIDVEDDGPGIPEEDWDRVFTAFARLDDSRTRSSGGYGLGLSIVRRIAYWHGGRAMVGKSTELGGARFSLIWPRQHDSEPMMSSIDS